MTLSPSQNGSAFFMILLAVALFAALTFALTQQRDTGTALSSERIRLYAAEVIDMGSKMADTVARMRLKRVPLEKVSFQNDIVDHYDNLDCTTETCRVYMLNGGGRDWETPAPEISNASDWGYTGSVSVEDIGTDDAELIAILPNIPLAICNRINVMLNVTKGPPPVIMMMVADKFTGTFAASPFDMTDPLIKGKKSGCVGMKGYSGSIFTTTDAMYAYYEVLSAR